MNTKRKASREWKHPGPKHWTLERGKFTAVVRATGRFEKFFTYEIYHTLAWHTRDKQHERYNACIREVQGSVPASKEPWTTVSTVKCSVEDLMAVLEASDLS